MKLFFSALILVALLGLTGPGKIACAAEHNPPPEKLSSEMGARISRVPEFEFIREQAAKLGVRVYLFGGTAAAYGHYVRQDLAREAGDTRYPKHFYDYDYTNIFRSTQDLDVVVDGSPEKATELENALTKKFPHFLGEKAQWEVRPLREARGDKEAILNNPDFQNQHTDSHSTGMVEVSQAPAGESAVKDVRDWNSKKPQFLTDIAEQKLHYYFNPLHGTTKRAKEGLNPPILSAIRYLTKAFQYDLAISGEDREKIQEIIRNFDPKSVKDDYVGKWIEKNGKKLFQHAVDIEYAWKTIDDLGLRQKLIAIHADKDTFESLAWWMNKEPLRTSAIGTGDGKTAAEIAKEMGDDKLIVAHETNSFLAYESITRSKVGELNGLISRDGAHAEGAVFGNGFYSQIGRSGAKNTGYTIRMEIAPNAREGTDFIRAHNFIILRNKAAVRLIPEQIQVSLPEFFRRLADENEFSKDDRALFEAFRRRIGRSALISPEEIQEVAEIVKAELKKSPPRTMLLEEWLSLPYSAEHPEILDTLFRRGGNLAELVIDSLAQESFWRDRPEFIEQAADYVKQNYRYSPRLFDLWLAVPESVNHPDIVKKAILLADDSYTREAFSHLSTDPHWVKDISLLKTIANEDHKFYVDNKILTSPELAEAQPRWWDDLIEKYLSEKRYEEVIDFALGNPGAAKHPKWMNTLLKPNYFLNEGSNLVTSLGHDHWVARPEWNKWVETALKKKDLREFLANGLFTAKGLPLKAEWVRALIQNKNSVHDVIGYTLDNSYWADHPELIEDIVHKLATMKNADYIGSLNFALGKEIWAENPRLLEVVGGKQVTYENLKKTFDEGFSFYPKMPMPGTCAGKFAEVSR